MIKIKVCLHPQRCSKHDWAQPWAISSGFGVIPAWTWAHQRGSFRSHLVFMMLYVTAFIPQNTANSWEQWAVWTGTALPAQGYFAAITSQEIPDARLYFPLSRWTTNSTQVSEVTLMPIYEKRKENQTYWSKRCCSFTTGCCFHLQSSFYSFILGRYP